VLAGTRHPARRVARKCAQTAYCEVLPALEAQTHTKKVFSPHLEKALTFLDDKLLPATSNAVERGNRRHRKMQKSVYRVRSQVCLEGRIALDMLRESRAEGRSQTTQALHQARRGST
jgi:hypothetical protein